MNQEDAVRVADRLRTLAELLEGSYVSALSIAHGWAGNMKAAALQPEGSSQLWCWEHERDVKACHKLHLACTGTPLTDSDRTGEAAVDAAAGIHVDEQRHLKLTAVFGVVNVKAGELAELIKLTVPAARRDEQAANIDSNIAPEGACKSCWRLDKHFSPTAARYRAYCLWCGEFKAAHGQEPPKALLDKRARGLRISMADVERHLGKVSA